MLHDESIAHGLDGSLVEPDWPHLTLEEVDRLLRRYPQVDIAQEIVSISPRPFSAASVVATSKGNVFVKRHPQSVRDREGLLEEHRLLAHLAMHLDIDKISADKVGADEVVVPTVLADIEGETAIVDGEWTYEVHCVADGVDSYGEAISWTPFRCAQHAHAAGRALAQLHSAARGFDAPARKMQQLISSFTIFAADDPIARMEEYLAHRPALQQYAEQRDWRASFHDLLLPLYHKLKPWLAYLEPLWTHNDLHASNLIWTSASQDAQVRSVIDLGLADRTNAVHDIATAIERNVIEWLRLVDPDHDSAGSMVHLDHLDAMLAGYEEIRLLGYEEAKALVAMLPLVHCEFALSETDYFLSILHSPEKAYLGYENYFLAHAEWFHSMQGRELLAHLDTWANRHAKSEVR